MRVRWSFYKGAWNAVRSKSINMDFLIALGTSVAYFYSVAVLFFPEHAERGGPRN